MTAQQCSKYSSDEIAREMQSRIMDAVGDIEISLPSNLPYVRSQVRNALDSLIVDGYLGGGFHNEYETVTEINISKYIPSLDVSFTNRYTGEKL